MSGPPIVHRPPETALTVSRSVRLIMAALTGLLLGVWLYATPPGLLGKADAIGYAICHRIEERSFHAHDRPLPMCARCTGIYLGVVVGLAYGAGRGRLRAAQLPRPALIMALLALGALYALDGLNSYLTLFPGYTPLYPPHNVLRLLSGFSFGLTLIVLVLPVANSIVWRAPQPMAPLASWRDLAGLYAAAGMTAGAVLTRQPALLLAAGLLSVLAVMGFFVMLGGLAFLMIARRENQARTWRDLAIPALAGVGFALLVIGGIDLARYLLTGTWDGFTLG